MDRQVDRKQEKTVYTVLMGFRCFVAGIISLLDEDEPQLKVQKSSVRYISAYCIEVVVNNLLFFF